MFFKINKLSLFGNVPLLALLIAAGWGTAHAQSVAMVTDVQGRAATQPVSGKPLTLAITTEIAGEATVRVEAGARLSVLYLASGDEYAFSGPAQIRFGKTAPQVLSGAPAQQRAVAKQGTVATMRLGSVTQAGLVMRGGNATGRLQLLTLAGTRTLEAVPEFRWQAVASVDVYHFRLSNHMGQVLHEADVRETAYRLPPAVRLARETTYAWEVSAQFADGRRHTGVGDFRVAAPELAAAVAAARPAADAPVAERVVYALWLEQQQLRDEARRHWRALLAERPDDSGLAAAAGAVQHTPRTVSDITAMLDQYQPDPQRVAALKASLSSELPAGASLLEQQNFYLERAYAAEELGLAARALADLRSAAVLVKDSPDEFPITVDIFRGELGIGNFNNALKLNEQMISMASGRRGRLISRYATAASLYASIGDVTAARRALRELEGNLAEMSYRRRMSQSTWDNWTSDLEAARANVLEVEGRYVDAEPFRRKVLAATERTMESRLAGTGAQSLKSPNRPYRSFEGRQRALARNLAQQGRLTEAELILRSVLQSQLQRVGRYAPSPAGTLSQLAGLLNEQGRYEDAEAIARAGIDIHRTLGSAPQASSYTGVRRALGASLVLRSRWQEGLTEFETLRVDLQRDGDGLTRSRAPQTPYRAVALIKTGRAAAAVPILEEALKAQQERLGVGHYAVAEFRGFLGMALAESGQRQRALDEFQRAAGVLLAYDPGRSDGDSGASARTWRLRLILDGYIRLLYGIRNEAGMQRAGFDAAEEAFRVADAARGQTTQRALSSSAARSAVNDPALAEMIRREQDARQQTGVLYATLLRLVSAPPDQQLPQVIAQMRSRISELEREQRTLSVDLLRRFPAYANLISPRPATVAAARAALRDGEVLLSLLTTDEQTYVWAVPKSGPVLFHAAPLGEKAVAEAVAVLRRALDVGHVTLDAVPDFDVAVAHRLYAALLQPVAGAWQGAHTLMVVANGALGQLPFSLLPTAAAAPGADSGGRFSRYQTVPWLLKQVAVTQLPAVNTLVTLRGMRAGAAQRTPFAGFGDPQFGPQLAAALQAEQSTLRMRSVALPGATAENWIPYSRLAPLPDTRDEILAIAKVLQADANSTYLGTAASKQNVLGAELSKRRIIAFATHGLVPGDFPDLDQPALALSAPGGSAEEGLLTLSDILALKLDADWIVLSACNTAAGDGAGAEAISGLGRGFFYAGSRALLVTHWPVETGAARTLVTGLFERYAADTKLGRAEALRQASLATMAGTGRDGSGRPFSYAHPLFWAPYALIGDGGR
jgi:CHAT domain-containing protein